jgi:tetratricopeptide (TPR) repeat protein
MHKMKKLLWIAVFTLLASVPALAQSSDELDLVKANNDMAVAFSARHYDDALVLAQKVLTLGTKLDGAESKTVADAHFNLGEIYYAKKQYINSIENLQTSLEIYRKNVAKDQAKILKLLNELGRISFEMKDRPGAEKWFLAAVDTAEKLYGKDGKENIDYLMNLGLLYPDMGERVKAEDFLWRALQLAGKAYPLDSEDFNGYYKIYNCMLYSIEDANVRRAIAERKNAERQKADGVERGVINGLALSLKKPLVPFNAQKMSGRVLVKVLINESGQVAKAEAFCGPSIFWQGSVKAALDSKFAPTMLKGKAVKVTGIIVYIFGY